MSATYLLLYDPHGRYNRDALIRAAARWLPFQPEATSRKTRAPGMELAVWSTFNEAARGDYVAHNPQASLAFNGWLVEPAPQRDRSTAASTLDWLGERDVMAAADALEGDFSALVVDQEGAATCWASGLAGQHVYYGQRNGLSVISNRASIAAAALHSGTLPSPDPLFLAWFASAIRAPLGVDCPWPDVKLLDPEHVLRLDARGFTLQRRALFCAPEGRASDWSTLYAGLRRRAASLRQLPDDVEVRMGLTGGKDSRLVLASLLDAGVADRVKTFYLRAAPDHPDAVVAERLCRHYGLPFERMDPATVRAPFLERLGQHVFLTEMSLHAWDLKALRTRPRHVLIHGNYGEIYKSHVLPFQAGGWPVIWRWYARAAYVDPHDVLTPPARAYLREQLHGWLRETKTLGWPALHVHDRLHRHARMQRWVGHTLMADACGTLSINPLVDDALLAHYLTLPVLQRREHRVHLELLRQHDDWLWRQGFARDQWSRALVGSRRGLQPPVQGAPQPTTRPMLDWRDFGASIMDYLLRPGPSPFFDLVRRDAVERLIARVRDQDAPHPRAIEPLYGLAGVRYALDEPFLPRPIQVEHTPYGTHQRTAAAG